MATLPKPRYPSEPHGPEARRAQGMRPPVSRNTSLLGLQPEIPVVGSQLATSEPGPLADVGVRLEQWAERLERVGKLLRRVGQWWVAADLRHCQLPILVLALGIWAISARVAWQSEESATPLLRERIAQLHEARARTAAAAPAVTPVPVPAAAAAPATRVPAVKTSATRATVTPRDSKLQPEEELQQTMQRESRSMASVLAASIESWFSPEPASREAVEGNPRIRVWVDLKTGLYYCPGAYHYGYKGARRGRVMLQKDAEYDYFQSATGAACQ